MIATARPFQNKPAFCLRIAGVCFASVFLPVLLFFTLRAVLAWNGVALPQADFFQSVWSTALLCSVFVCSGLAGWWSYKFQALRLLFLQQTYFLYVALVEIFILITIYWCALLLEQSFVYTCAIVCAVLTPGSLFLLMRAMDQIILGAQAQERGRHLEAQCTMLVTHYHALGEQLSQTHKMRQEISERLQAMEKQLNSNEPMLVDRSFQQLEAAFQSTCLPIYCAHPIVNALLYNKLTYAAAQEIVTHVHVRLLAKIDIPDVDLLCLFSNLLDNAIESCEKLPHSERELRVSDLYQNSYYILKVVNSKQPAPLAMQKNKPRTDKPQPQLHGYGIEIVQNVVERHQGMLRLHDLGGIFEAVALLRLPE